MAKNNIQGSKLWDKIDILVLVLSSLLFRGCWRFPQLVALPVPGEAGGDQLPGPLGAGLLRRGDGAGWRDLLHLHLERDVQTLRLNVAGHLT